jgi:tRNA(Ile)-lysidine synthase
MLSLKDELLASVAEFISRFSITRRERRFAVAVSGGADSVVLLHALHRLSSEFGLMLRVVHVNHRLRGIESEEDEQFVRQLAQTLQLEIDVVASPVGGLAGNLEQLARDARRAAFLSLIQLRKAEHVALGHTLSDQAETVLFRLLRGSGLAGIAGMKPVTPEGFIRPLLSVTREQVRTWAANQGLAWREDSTNEDSRFRRNFLRNEVIPPIKRVINPAVEMALARTAATAQAEEEYWDHLIEGLFENFAGSTHYGLLCNVDYLNAQHLAVQRRLIRRAFRQVKGDLKLIDIAHVDAVLNICRSQEGHDRVQVPGLDALRSYGTLRIAADATPLGQRHYRIPVIPGKEIDLPFYAGRICISAVPPEPRKCQIYDKFIDVKDHSEKLDLDSAKLGGAEALNRLVVRNWAPGDEYQPVGCQAKKKVKELFQQNRVLLWERRHWPVLDLDGEIVWVKRFGPAAGLQREQGGASAVSLTYIAVE